MKGCTLQELRRIMETGWEVQFFVDGEHEFFYGRYGENGVFTCYLVDVGDREILKIEESRMVDWGEYLTSGEHLAENDDWKDDCLFAWEGNSMIDAVEELMKVPIFDGKTIPELEDRITVTSTTEGE